MLKTIIPTAIVLTLASPAFSKAHDQGVADGTQPFGPGDAAGIVQTLVNKGQQGDAKKLPANRGGVEPVVGANAPDAEE